MRCDSSSEVKNPPMSSGWMRSSSVQASGRIWAGSSPNNSRQPSLT